MKRGTVSSLQVGTAEYLAEKEFTLTALQLYHLQAFTWLLTFRTAIAMVSSGRDKMRPLDSRPPDSRLWSQLQELAHSSCLVNSSERLPCTDRLVTCRGNVCFLYLLNPGTLVLMLLVERFGSGVWEGAEMSRKGSC